MCRDHGSWRLHLASIINIHPPIVHGVEDRSRHPQLLYLSPTSIPGTVQRYSCRKPHLGSRLSGTHATWPVHWNPMLLWWWIMCDCFMSSYISAILQIFRMPSSWINSLPNTFDDIVSNSINKPQWNSEVLPTVCLQLIRNSLSPPTLSTSQTFVRVR